MAHPPPSNDVYSKYARPLVESGAPGYILAASSLLLTTPWSRAPYPANFPRPPIVHTCAAFWAFGGFMASTGYPVDGAMTIAVWSFLYQIVNGGKRALVPMLKGGRIGPVAMAVTNIGVGGTAGWYWWNTRRYVEAVAGGAGGKSSGWLG